MRILIYFSKLILTAAIFVFSFALIQCGVKDFTDDAIYSAMTVVLKNQHPDDDGKVECMIADLRRNKVADKFYTADLLINQDKLAREIQPYTDEANFKCTLILFFQTPIGICVIVALFLLAFSVICCLIRCICC